MAKSIVLPLGYSNERNVQVNKQWIYTYIMGMKTTASIKWTEYNTYNTKQHNTTQHNTTQYNTMQCNAMQCNAMQCNISVSVPRRNYFLQRN